METEECNETFTWQDQPWTCDRDANHDGPHGNATAWSYPISEGGEFASEVRDAENWSPR